MDQRPGVDQNDIKSLCMRILDSTTPKFGKPTGNRLTRCLCNGDKFEIEIFEAKRQKAGICGACSKMFATWISISIGRRVTQVQKCGFRLRSESVLIFECCFSCFECNPPLAHPFLFPHVSKHSQERQQVPWTLS